MFRRASLGFVLACALWLAPLRPALAQLPCGNWACFADETGTRLVLTSDSPAVAGNPDPLEDGSSDEMDMDCADVDLDGDQDCVMVYKQLGTTTGKRRNWLFMNEDGVLVDRTTEFASASSVGGDLGFLTPTNDRDVVLADVTGDGWPEIITAVTLSGSGGGPGVKSISHPRIYLNLADDPPGSGNWQGFLFDDPDRVPTMAAEPRFCSVSAGDIDNDGDVDLYLGDYQQGGSRTVDLNDRLWINDGTGYFSDESSARMTFEMLESSFAMATVIADFNGDNRLDIVKDDALNAPQAVSISYNNLNDSTTDGFYNSYDLVYEFAAYHVSASDLNGDGKLDMIFSDDVLSYHMINEGNLANGQVDWSPRFTMGGAPNQFDSNNGCADFDQDGFPDCWVLNMDVDLPDFSCNQRGHIFHNSGGPIGGSISLNHQGDLGIALNAYRGSHDGYPIDVNGDGWPDWVTGSCHGTWVYINQPPFGISVSYPAGAPDRIDPDAPATFDVEVTPFGGEPIGGGMNLMVSVDGGAYTAVPLVPQGGDLFEAELPASDCMAVIDYYIEVEFSGGLIFTDPAGAPGDTYTAVSALEQITYQENVESDTSEWTVLDDAGLTAGSWEPADPHGTLFNGNIASPEDAAEGLMAFVTQNCAAPGCSAGEADIDGGGTELISQTFDLDGSDADFTYLLWFYNSSTGLEDSLSIFVTNEAEAADPQWVLVNSINDSGGAWIESGFRVSDFVTPTTQVALRFRAEDIAPGSIAEAGVDLVRVNQLVCEACSTNHCCDLDSNGIRDDGCVWCECDGTPCNGLVQQIPIVFADMGGTNGGCDPDGVADANDRFHALNCFSNQNTMGTPGYNCEANPPNAFNVDAGSEFGACPPDGVCDGHDAFHALNAFTGDSACTCPLDGPAPNFPNEPQVAGRASVTLSAGEEPYDAGQLIHVDAMLDKPVHDLRGYQLHVTVDGGRRGTLELVDILVEDRDNTAFAGVTPWRAFNVQSQQMLAGLDTQGVAVDGGSYLASFVFRASKDAAGTFVVDLRHDDDDAGDRTFLFGSLSSQVVLESTTAAVIRISGKSLRLSNR